MSATADQVIKAADFLKEMRIAQKAGAYIPLAAPDRVAPLTDVDVERK